MAYAGVLVACLLAADFGNRAEYVGGTLPDVTRKLSGRILAGEATHFYFRSKSHVVKVPFESINLIEYGQKADRRYLEAIVLSPLFLLAKRRAHFLTIGYTDASGRQQALVFRLDKDAVRPVLAVMEARTGLRVKAQDDEARKGPR
jgi:hypothetical protein